MCKTVFMLMMLFLVAGFCGCAGMRESMSPFSETEDWDPLNKKSNDENEVVFKEGFGQPVSMASIWKGSIYEQAGIVPVRGFGGRFFFYDKNNNPLKADGDLIIYGFDDAIDDGSNGSAPKKKFVFRATELQSHYSDSGLGPSYSVWIPWEKIGGYRKTITLIPVFRLADGSIIRSDQSINLLPGKPLEAEAEDQGSNRPYKVLGSSSAVVKDASRRRVSSGTSASGSQVESNESLVTDLKLKTSTIKVTKNLAQQMANASPQLSEGRFSSESDREPMGNNFAKGVSRSYSNEYRADTAGASQSEPGGSGVNSQNLPVKPKRWAYGAPGPFNK